MNSVCIVIPCYKSGGKLEEVVNSITKISNEFLSKFIIKIIVVNDSCPFKSWKDIEINSNIEIIHHKKNLGVGAATLTGFKTALEKGFDAIIKIDSDGQHPAIYLKDIIPYLLNLPKSETCLIKGSRYLYRINEKKIPWARKIGSLFLEPIARGALCCRDLSDISNGYIAMNNLTCKLLVETKFGPKLKNRYLFESSLLVKTIFFNIPIHVFAMHANYGENWNSSMNSKEMILPLMYFWLKAGMSRLLNKYIFRLNLGTLLLFISSLSSFNSLNLFLTRIRPFVKAGITVSAGNSSYFTTSSAIAIFTLLLFFLYDYNSGIRAKSIIFPVFLEELEI